MAERAWTRKGAPLCWEETRSGSAVVFDPETGATHFLSDLPTILLKQVGDDPADLAGLIDRIDGPSELAPDEKQRILSTLVTLEQAELITSEDLVSD